MDDEFTDILGSGLLNVKPQSGFACLSFASKTTIILGALLLSYIASVKVWNKILKWRELSYRLSMRRRHGIPDSDHRPFAVAYAAVQQARERREALASIARNKTKLSEKRQQAQAHANQDIRHRAAGSSNNVEPAWNNDRFVPHYENYNLPTPQDINYVTIRPSSYTGGLPPVSSNEERVIYPRATELVSQTDYPVSSSLRAAKNTKKTSSGHKSNGYSLPDDGVESIRSRRIVDIDEIPKRGSKREFGDADEAEDVLESKKAREKRARRLLLEEEVQSPSEEEMEIDMYEMDDEVGELDYVSRGRKRDRAEAGSTFGGDDDSDSDDFVNFPETTRRSRKRRSILKKRSDAVINQRGTKRDRDIDDEPSDDGSDRDSLRVSSRKRRNRRNAPSPEQSDEDVSMDDSPASSSRARKIGEEWVTNGVRYKIGPNGERLRQALIKKARQKYHMPADSQHPDRNANLEICVETWLTEDDYQDVKAQQLLAWQDSPKSSAERELAAKVEPPPSPNGKSLLWKSASPSMSTPELSSTVATSPVTPTASSKRIGYDLRRQSTTSDLNLKVNPFQHSSLQPNKRVASVSLRTASVTVPSTGLIDSTNASPRTSTSVRIYSKWEKQDLEAAAMMKMREAARKKEVEEKERQEKERAEKEKEEKAKAAATKPLPIVPIISVTKPAEEKVTQPESKQIPNFFAKPAEPAKDTAKPAEPSMSQPFSFPSASKPESKPAEIKPSLFPIHPSTGSQSGLPFSLPKPTTGGAPPETSAKPAEQLKPQPTFPFSATQQQGMPATAPAVTPSPMFTFAKPETKKDEPAASQSTPAPSLLSRLGGQTPSAAPPSSPMPSFFNKPAEQPKAASTFTVPTATAPAAPAQFAVQPSVSSAPQAPSTSTSTTPGLKFNFMAPTKSTAMPTAPQAPASVASSTSAETQKPLFSFKASGTPSFSTTASSQGPKAADAGKSPFSGFGTGISSDAGAKSSVPNPFSGNTAGGATNTSNFGTSGVVGNVGASAMAAPSTSTAAPKTAFTTFGPSSNAGANAATTTADAGNKFMFGPSGVMGAGATFGNHGMSSAVPSAEAPKATGFSGFGNPQTTPAAGTPAATPSAFSSASNTFGGNGASNAFTVKPAEANKSPFAFGQTSTLGAAPTTGASEQPKSPFFNPINNMGTTTVPTSAPSTNPSTPKFSFGVPNNMGKPMDTNIAATNMFGMGATPNASSSTNAPAPAAKPFTFGLNAPSVLPSFGMPSGGQAVFGNTAGSTNTTAASQAGASAPFFEFNATAPSNTSSSNTPGQK
ncbi:hypothetical protein AMATHDRAFT_63529 [Amanita thiersii Skay4041]|uniref:Uncharacterized protein n=1 Tax=Amanita thiersii Skay4041 TaxID=703135 RepID=A0A2A9NNK4_9AGAR|nr:hypothetical protein AMATHDRAFT_63529 [Amanita thiersii Skay4041]